MLRYLFYFLVLIAVIGGGGYFLFVQSDGVTVVTLNEWSVEMKTAAFILLLLLTFISLYFFINVLRYLLSLKSRVKQMNTRRLNSKANKELNQGLLLLSEGQWQKAGKLLLKNVEYVDTPLISYLAAAKTAHMQTEYEQRDEWLKKAIESDAKADIAVSVAQAEMQLDSDQVAQSLATLLRLKDLSPEHPYVNKLLAKVYLKQKNWQALFDLIPILYKQKASQANALERIKLSAISGLFGQYAEEKKTADLIKAWKKLPSNVRENPDAVLTYATALQQSGDDKTAADTLLAGLKKQWDERLVAAYGCMEHVAPAMAIKPLQGWLSNGHEQNPILLLALARINRQQKLWGKAKSFYESSLNLKPDSEAYVELAELFEETGETENANICYRAGLRFCVQNKTEVLSLKVGGEVNRPVPPVIDHDEEFHPV